MHNVMDHTNFNNAIRFRINQEIKFLYCKKQHLNQRLYYLHLEGAHQYNDMLPQHPINKRELIHECF